MKPTIVSATLTLLAAGWLPSQSSTQLAYEVASIKPSAEDQHRIGIQMMPGGGLRASGTTLKFLLTLAYDVREFQISGGPGWINSDRYDIVAKAERAGAEAPPTEPQKMTDAQMKTAREQMQQRLQALLADRFQLAIHRETKDEPVYVLVVGKNGPKIQPSENQNGGGGGARRMMMGRGVINGQGVEMVMLTSQLSNQLGRPVLDRTGLTGHFDIKLEWAPDPGQSAGPFGGTPPPGVEAPPPPNSNGPSLFTAVQEQLGLRLESQRGPVEMIVIDKIEKPSEN